MKIKHSGLRGKANTGAPTAVTTATDVSGNFDEFGSLRIVVTNPATGNDPEAGGTGYLPVQGTVAHDAVDAGNPNKIGGQANTGAPTAVASLDRVNANFDEFGSLRVVVTDPGTGVEIATGVLPVRIYQGTTAAEFNTETDEHASAAEGGSANGNLRTSVNIRGIIALLDITAVSGTSPTMDLKPNLYSALNAAFDGDGQSYTDSAGNAIQFVQKIGTGNDHMVIYPGIAEKLTGVGRRYSTIIPRSRRWYWTIGGTSPSFTFELDSQEIV